MSVLAPSPEWLLCSVTFRRFSYVSIHRSEFPAFSWLMRTSFARAYPLSCEEQGSRQWSLENQQPNTFFTFQISGCLPKKRTTKTNQTNSALRIKKTNTQVPKQQHRWHSIQRPSYYCCFFHLFPSVTNLQTSGTPLRHEKSHAKTT